MIKYYGGAYGLQILLRLHGSAVFKSLTPALLSTAIYQILWHTYVKGQEQDILEHPYPMGALLVAFSFLLTFKMSFSYDRYWEAVTAVHLMHSKWLDVGMQLAAFHLQSSTYQKPPAFGHHPETVSIQRERERLTTISRQELEERIEQIIDDDNNANADTSMRTKLQRWASSPKLRIRKTSADSPEVPPDDDNDNARPRLQSWTSEPKLNIRKTSTDSPEVPGEDDDNDNARTRLSRWTSSPKLNIRKTSTDSPEVPGDDDDNDNARTRLQRWTSSPKLNIRKTCIDSPEVPPDDDDNVNARTRLQRWTSKPKLNIPKTSTDSPEVPPDDDDNARTWNSKPKLNIPETRTDSPELPGDDDDDDNACTRLQRWTSKPKLNKSKTSADLPEVPGNKTVGFSADVAIIQEPGSPQEGDCGSRVISKKVDNGGTGSEQASLFLQETAHLLSLLSAVAFSTLRNDLEQAESPLATFEPGIAWPCVDPDEYNAEVRKDWTRTEHRFFTVIRYLFGRTRSRKDQTLYNAARPFRVVGGVSDAEIQLLQAARGSLAKVALCSMWLQEFITREYMAGSTGRVDPPIISRLYQQVSDGMLGYNQARKIAYIPFPFPHAQITSLFILVVVAFIPVLMMTFVDNQIFGAVLNCLTVMCFTGLHEVSRELENPFQNVPNDIPLNNFQAQYNESLMTMYLGYHPEAFWEVEVLGGKTEKLKTGDNDAGERAGIPVVKVGGAKEAIDEEWSPTTFPGLCFM